MMGMGAATEDGGGGGGHHRRHDGAGVGMFGDERIMQFFIHLKKLVDDCFTTLHTMALTRAKGERCARTADEVARRNFVAGLAYVHEWDDSIHIQEAENAKRQFPGIDSDYRYCLRQFLVEKYRHSDRVQLRPPAFRHFLYWIVRRVAQERVMQTMQ